MSKTFSIYIATCLPTGKQYVGQTIRTVAHRWNVHVRDARRGSKTYLHHAIRKYGKDAFKVVAMEIPSELANKENMDRAEKRFIVELGTRVPNGYNLTDGGEGVLGRTVSAETRRKISAGHRGRKFSAEHCLKLSEARRGHKQSAETIRKRCDANRGHKRTAETRIKMSNSMRGIKKSVEHRLKIGDANRGRPWSGETRRKRSKSL
jgi:group I intron endonuclease